MEHITLDNINDNLLILKREIDSIKEMLEESDLELADDVKVQIEESRKRSSSEFRTQKEIEQKFL